MGNMSILINRKLFAELYLWPQKIPSKPKGLLNTAEPLKQLRSYQKATVTSR